MHHTKVSFICRFASVLFLLISLLISSSPSSAQEITGKPPLKIVQLGDSYSAGNGARSASGETNYEGPSDCYRSPTNWGSQFADSLRDTFAVEYQNGACSGSVVADITHERYMGGPFEYTVAGQCPVTKFKEEEYKPIDEDPTRCARYLKPQYDIINNSVDLVVMTIGGNDLGFGDIVTYCFTAFAHPVTCRNAVNKANGNMSGLRDNLIEMFGKIKARLGDGAKIAYVAYPQLVMDVDYRLVVQTTEGIIIDDYAAGAEIRALGITGEAYQKEAVAAANKAAGENYIVFYDGTKTLFAGHETDPSLYSRNPKRWLREFEGFTMMEWYHPNEPGHANWGQALSPFETFGGSSGALQGKTDIDVAFVVDTTGSMGEEIAQVQANLSNLVNQLAETTNSYRVAVVSYRDSPDRTGYSGDYPAKVIQDFTDNPALIQTGINSLTLGYGGDWEETVFSGVQAAINLPWRPGVTKIMLVIGDAPALAPEPIFPFLTAPQIVANSIAVDPVQVIGVDVGYLNDNGAVGEIASGTGGSVIQGTSNLAATISGILDRAAKQPIAWIGQTYSGKIGQPVQFDASGSYDPSGLAITRYEWDFNNDGVYDLETTEPTATHVYSEAFDDYVVVRVTGPGGTALASAPTVVNEQGYAPQGGEKACELDARGYSIIVENGILINCTPTNLPENYLDGVSAVIGDPLESALTDLGNAINGLSPVAFRNQYEVIKKAIENNNTASACGSLQGMTGLANAQTGKKITQEQAATVIKAVGKLETILGCAK